ncbi:MAG: hypothetical protein Q3M30_00525 [Candidatus Electrothrix sp. Rat3]|nr:hypothetical protein [Candidatus Electrothrix rattekaaiensis]
MSEKSSRVEAGGDVGLSSLMDVRREPVASAAAVHATKEGVLLFKRGASCLTRSCAVVKSRLSWQNVSPAADKGAGEGKEEELGGVTDD